MSKYLQTSLAAMTHLAEGLCFNALLTLKVENSLICLVGTRMATESKMEGQFILPLKTFIISKASKCRRLEWSILKFKEFTIELQLRKKSANLQIVFVYFQFC
jgi:hypothetical protein